MRKLLIIALSFALCLSLSPAVSVAGSSLGNMYVSATVDVTCVMNVGSMDFGQYSGSNLIANSTIEVQCSDGTSYTLNFGAGNNNPSNDMRRMALEGMGDLLEYTLNCPQEPGFDAEEPCGDGVVGGINPAGVGTGSVQTFTIQGYVPSGQFVSSGDYYDNVQVTLTF